MNSTTWPITARALRWLSVALGLVLGLAWLNDWLSVATHLDAARATFGIDYTLYTDAARRWVAGGGFYYPWQLAGPYPTSALPILYPPPSLLLFVPFLVLPSILWWVLPIGVTVLAVVAHRPSVVAWAGILLCLWWPPTNVKLWTGNPVIWAMAAVALGTHIKPAFVLALVKPSLAPFALLGVRDRGWWLALAVLGLVALLFAPMWPDYARVILNARDPYGLIYSVAEVPMLMLPTLAWLGRARPKVSRLAPLEREAI